MEPRKVIIIGAAGRDFHNFNMLFRHNRAYKVVAFTAYQIPDIDGRKYPAPLAGPDLYPDGIPIVSQNGLAQLIKTTLAGECIFSYSDISYQKLMNIGAEVNSAGAAFTLPSPAETMLKSTKPIISVCAVRTGAGKSQTSRKVIELLLKQGLKVIAVRHPMPYGDLALQKVQRFATIDDLSRHQCTIEEMEEYEPHIVRGNVIYAGVDYQAILRAAENDPDGCDVIVWDGGNNDFPFFRPDLAIAVADPMRPNAEISYYPGEVNIRMADVVIINKIDSALPSDIETVRKNISRLNPEAILIEAASPVAVTQPTLIRGKRVLVVEDGPTLTHGEMKIGAGTVAAQKFGAKEIVDPRPWLTGKLAETFKIYPEIGTILPAMGYGKQQINDLEATINQSDCDTVIIGTPIDLGRIININKPSTRVSYDLEEIGAPKLDSVIADFCRKMKL